jgi:hypothetical protein
MSRVARVELLLICDEEEREPRLKPNGMQIILIPLPVLRFWFMGKGLAARLVYSFFPVLPISSNRDKKINVVGVRKPNTMSGEILWFSDNGVR